MEWTPAGRVEGWTGPAHPVVNEMLLHDVYELPLEDLRGALSLWSPALKPDELFDEQSYPFHPGGIPCRRPPSQASS